ncbi:MAG: peptide chain release factor N(5)-glutamine methyltransferase [Lachnospiraceae bacterium]|nr:peptide chain release factor N(5)-glutamine methyltransferase [Lachnospiraceae bacterium]
MTYSELMTTGVTMLTDAGFEEARTDVRVLLLSVCGVDFMTLLRDGALQVPEEKKERFFAALAKRKKHVPVQYITGEQEFCGLKFYVGPEVLIPRPETELLAEAVFRESAGKRILDMCTGSGCIAVTAAKLGTPSFVAASDYSAEALSVARKNAELHDVKITFFQGDLFETVEGVYDIIVSNPPYIRSEVIETLMPEVREHEPRLALDGTKDGVYFYRRIVAEAKAHLVPGGRLLFEIGHDQAKEVTGLLSKEGYTEIEVRKDYAGLDRMVFAVWPVQNKEKEDV